MFCRKCGTEISSDCDFCPRCGEKTTKVAESSNRDPASQLNGYKKTAANVVPAVNNEPADPNKNENVQGEPADTQPSSTQQTCTQPAQTQQTYAQPAQTQQSYAPPAQTQQTYAQPAQTQQTYAQPAQTQQSYAQPAQTQQSYTPPAQTQQSYTPPAQTQQSYTPPAQTQQTYAQPTQTQQTYAQPTQTQQTYAQPAHKKTKNKKLFWGILSAAFVLCIILAVVITVNVVNQRSASSQDEATTAQERNTLGNTPSNILCDGIAAIQGNTIYYMQVDKPSNDDILMSMNLDGKNTQELYSFEGDISTINVIGNQVFFIGDIYDDNNNIKESGIYVYDLINDKTTNLFNYEGSTLYFLYVTADQLYFLKSNDEDYDKIISSNLDGSNEQTVLEKEDYINRFTVLDSSFYYIYQDTVYRCDLDGQNTTSLYAFDTPGPLCIENGKFYISDNGANNTPVISSMNLKAENETALATFDTNESILYLNAVDDTIYYAINTENEKGNVTSCKICSMHNDGTNKQTLVTADNGIYGLAIFDHWLFYYNNDDYETVIVDLNDL